MSLTIDELTRQKFLGKTIADISSFWEVDFENKNKYEVVVIKFTDGGKLEFCQEQ